MRAVKYVKCLMYMWAWECCRISPPHFLAECRKRQLNQASFVMLYFALFAFSALCLVSVLSVLYICKYCIFNLSSVMYFPA